jgi:mono/diheme cytochrome c family protein
MRALALVLLLAGCAEGPAPSTTSGSAASAVAASATATASATSGAQARVSLEFKRDGKRVRSLSLAELEAGVGAETFSVVDPYYNKKKTFAALPLAAVVKRGFDGQDLALEKQHFVLRALDGYTVPIDGTRLLEAGGFLAFDDVDVDSGWEPIGPQQVSPAPFYLVWRKDEQRDTTTHPRPWQLAAIEISPFEASFPHTVPEGEQEGSPARLGFALFREQCIRCHAINRDGGRIGPDLNVPQSIVEYRPVAQIKSYIKNPLTFRYSTMPAHPHLSEQNLDQLVAYFRSMSQRKHDPGGAKEGTAH